MIKKLHNIACKILQKNLDPYTSHTWHRSAATNLADTSVSFINLKRHWQWLSDSVVEGCIANLKPLQEERLHCLMHNSEKNGYKENKGQQKETKKMQTITRLLELTRKLMYQVTHLNLKVPTLPLSG